MIADGLPDDQIMHALGYNEQTSSGHVLPNGHEHSNKMTTEQEEKEAQAAELGQPGMEGEEGGDEEGDDEGGLLSHVAGILQHVTKKKPKKAVKK